MAVLVLKVDIDTLRGMREGLPSIAASLDRRSLKGSFFVSFGPDRSGLAVLQLLRPRFLLKMIRTNAPGMYGLKTALYGTLLPAPLIGAGCPEAVRQLNGSGHETACHAWDHRLWQDWLHLMSRDSIAGWFEKMVDAYRSTTGKKPSGFGAPGWRMDVRTLEAAAQYDFTYLSCTRAEEPFRFEENGMIEVPSNLPCIEEVGVAGVIEKLKMRADSTVIQVLPVHAEVEGGMYREQFEHILDVVQSLGYTVKRMIDAVRDMDTDKLTTRPLKSGMIPGRAFKCSV